MESISEEDVDDLYENYRYGRRLSFYLYLLPSGLARPDMVALQETLDESMSSDHPDLMQEIIPGAAVAETAIPTKITLLDEEELDGFGEIRYRYFVTHRFLNVEEEPDQVLQSRYGFLWLDLDLGYLAVLSRDERVNRQLTRALSKSLQAIPLPIRFPREVLDQHFSIESAKRLSYYDPGTGVRRSISGHGLWQRFQQEIMDREREFVRPSSLYDEEVAEGMISGLGVASSKGKIYLTRTLPTSVVRNWARQRLPGLMQDVKALRVRQPSSFSRSIETVNRMRLPSAGRASINIILEALLQIEREDLTSVDLPQTAQEIYDALAGKYFSPYLRTLCSICDETAEVCPHCESRSIEVGGASITCASCSASLSDEELVTLRCMNGHVTSVPLVDAWNIAPNHWLQKRMVRIFAEVRQTWHEKDDYFHIEGRTLYRLHRGTEARECLPQVIQNYISNFWDPVTGQVHAGSGDIVIGSPLWESTSEMPPPSDPPPERPQKIRRFKTFDLQIRGDALTGYTVEATAGNGPTVPVQPLRVPNDERFQQRLDGILDHSRGNGDIQVTGEALFKAVFPQQIRQLWASSVENLGRGEGLRVTLHIEPPELLTLPWELLYEDDFIGLLPRFPIVRFLDLPNPPPPLVLHPPLRLLIVVSGRNNGSWYDADSELTGIREALAELAGQIEVRVLDATNRDELLAGVRQGCHIVHYIGEGSYQEDEGYLALGRSCELSATVSASLLGQVAAESQCRLVVLSARTRSSAEPLSALSSVAPRLVSAGVPAAVAMQLTPEDETSVAFSRGFYRSLAAGQPVDVAMQKGRSDILSMLGDDSSRSVDWALPTLYMRTPNGVILGIQEKELEANMKRRDELRPTVTYTPTFHGPVHGPVHTGSGDINVDSIHYGLDANDLEGLFRALSDLVAQQSPPDRKDEALQEVGQLQQAVEEDVPNLSKMESVLNWFKDNIPQLAGAVTSVILNPIVGKIVEAAGDLVAEEFTRRFGG
ncbi:CHAT domain-containing protein [Chloroflexota bacterium]